MPISDDVQLVLATLDALWQSLGEPVRPLPPARIVGEGGGLPSVYAVDALACAAVGAATAGVAELLAARRGGPAGGFEVDRQHAAAAFRSERYLAPIGWELPALWDPIAGDYPAADGWIRLHTNYLHHRDAALRALDAPADRGAVARAVARRSADEIEAAVVAEGGAAARQRTADEWAAHPQGQAIAAEPLFSMSRAPIPAAARPVPALAPGAAPLTGIRVLDLTRVVAGPVCTRVLAGYGADVLRLDPPGFAEVPALLPDTTVGKRRAALDLRAAAGRAAFEQLVAGADLLICGYRASALDRLDLGIERLQALNPALSVVLLDAYGWSGPWRDRRGFDSLVQMSTGITVRGSAAIGAPYPVPLPAQALDHGAGYLMAAAACRALTERLLSGVATQVRVSLARVALQLEQLPRRGDPRAPDLADAAPWRERTESSFGPLDRVRCPGRLDDFVPRWSVPAGPLGVDASSVTGWAR